MVEIYNIPVNNEHESINTVVYSLKPSQVQCFQRRAGISSFLQHFDFVM